MAGDWIKINKSLLRDPRVVRISSALQADRLRTVGGLLSVWCLFDEQTDDGRLAGYTPEIMDDIIGFHGLARAMESVGWLTVGADFIEMPRFTEHNGNSAKRRAQDSVRKMSARKADKLRTDCGPEKRREEKIKESKIPQSGQSEKKRFVKPTIEEVAAYGATLNPPFVRALEFCSYYESNGWKVGKNQMKSWQGAVRTWHAKDSQPTLLKPKFNQFTVGDVPPL